MAHRPSSPRQRATTRTGSALSTSQLPSGPILPQSTRSLVEKITPERRHAGLQLDKLSSAGEQEKQREALEKVARTLRDNTLLKKLLDRRTTMLEALGARQLTMTTRGALTLHLSRSGALENAGIALHPVYGFVYLPGSGIKGLTRAWAETVWAPAQPSREEAWRWIEKAFGWSPQSEKHKFPQPKKGLPGWRPDEIEPQPGASVGRLVFHDAWPTRWPHLTLDIVNNHYKDYYEGKDDPGDWENPNPVYFLAVGGGEEFEFSISDRKPADDDLLETACGWLREALTFEGAGAKTAAGYGRFKPTEGETAVTLSPGFTNAGFASASYEVRLVSPAFLAGANQKKDDCDLRPATLRGLLRWWWRTMHSAHLSRDTLKKLETAVWGDAQSGSPVRIAVDDVEGSAAVLYDHKGGFQPKAEFKKANDLEDSPNRKTTQGLFYASYGMDDGPKHDKKQRYYRAAGSIWRVTLAARAGRCGTASLSADLLLRQANAALWLLCRYGGVGSRGRKGFGSFMDLNVRDIASTDACETLASTFRQTCGLQKGTGSTPSPTLEKMQVIEIETPWKNPWTALDQLGYVVQAFAQKYAHDERKRALGLPRKIHGPRQQPMPHQSPATHKPPLELSAKKGKRHAAPVHYHLVSTDGKLFVRATAFPSHFLPSFDESERMLNELLSFLDTELKQRAKLKGHIGHREAKPQQAGPGDGLPKANDRVEAELLEEKTRKGGWKAKHSDSGLEGPIQDPQNVPADAEPGQRVELTVASVSAKEMAFKWAEPPLPKKKPNRNRVRTPRRERR